MKHLQIKRDDMSICGLMWFMNMWLIFAFTSIILQEKWYFIGGGFIVIIWYIIGVIPYYYLDIR